MEWWQAIILGIVQGLTEFLPVSSSGHLLLLQEVMGVTAGDAALDAFDVALHAATLTALYAYFRDDLHTLARAWVTSVASRRVSGHDQKMSWLILLGTLPALAFYGVASNVIEAAQDNEILIASMLIGVCGVFLLADWRAGRRDISSIRWVDALLVGCGQALALIPGTSRSGASISAGMLLGFDRQAAARFSFLLSAPVVTLAFISQIPDLAHAGRQDTGYIVATVLGFMAAAASGYLAVAGLLRFLGGHALSWFALYRVPVGVLFLVYFSANGG